MSTINVSNLQASGGAGTAATLASLNGGHLAGMRNRLINSDMRIDQRNAGASISSSTGVVTYSVDRWYVYATGAAVSAQQVTPSLTDINAALRVIGAASNTGVSIGQRIERANSYDLAGQTVTLSFYAASSASITLTWKIFYAGANNDFSTKTQSNTGTQATNSTLTKYSATFTLPSAATTGIAVEFSVSSLTSGSIDITGVQLEAGSVSTPLERRSYGQELALCQRYYESVSGASISAARGFQSDVSVRLNIFMRQTKRATPTCALSGASGWSAGPNADTVSVDIIHVSGNSSTEAYLTGYTATAEL